MFVNALNQETMKYGIKSPINEVQFGKEVNFLDLTLYLENDNTIQYHGYTKPTDSKRYLNPKSFHPRSVFDSIPFSQLLRTVRNNSKEETCNRELEKCVQDFKNSGYKENDLQTIREKALTKSTTNPVRNSDNTGDELVFPVHYFQQLNAFKAVVRSMKTELNELVGNTHITFAVKKRSSIGSMLVRNKQLSAKQDTTLNGQKCNAPGCRQCPLVSLKERPIVNGIPLTIPKSLNCKSKNIIYMWNCKLCNETYFGRTIQHCHNRTSGHRSCFNNEDKVEKSALSMHAKECHIENFSLETFSISVVKQVSPQQLRREEFKFIDKFRTASLGLKAIGGGFGVFASEPILKVLNPAE